MAGNLGATALSLAAANLERALKQPETPLDLTPEIEILDDALASLVVGIRAHLSPDEEKTAVSQDDAARSGPILAELKRLLAEDDTRAAQVMREHAQLLRAALGERASELERQIETFDYEAAVRTLDENM